MLPNLFDDRSIHLRLKVTATYALLVAANAAAWVWAWIEFADRPALLGTALIAYMFGLRHAFDADHLAAIDNVVRKLIQDGKQPFSTGFFFSLGHSTVVIVASVIIAFAASSVHGRLSAIHEFGGVVGTSISAIFLIAIGVANLFIVKDIWGMFHRARLGEKIVEEELEAVLSGRGMLARLFRRTFQLVSRSWHMYPIGFLFGLGFDTATEIGVLGISASQAAHNPSISSILVFPALFTAGMSLVDTTDSLLMTGAYGWAFVKPIRKLWYNLTITAASVAIAVFVGGLEALGLIRERLRLEGGVWHTIADLNGNLTFFGYAIVAISMASWLLSAVIYRSRGYDQIMT